MCKVVKMPIGTRVVNVADIKQIYISNIVDAEKAA